MSSFIVNIKFNSSVKIPVQVQSDWTIKHIKDEIFKQQNIPAEQVRIIFQGKELHNAFSLHDCDLGNHSVLHVVRGRKTNPDISAGVVKKTDNNTPETRRRQFFVYCKSKCNDICPGKLRVRCGSCKQGTITLCTEPQNWDDVLQADRIPGECQAHSCHGNRAEFYFKCASHDQTSEDDTAVALHLVRSNIHHVPCVTCTDVGDSVLVFPCTVGHAICLDCFKLYCTTLLNERRFIEDPEHGYTLGCPAGCTNSLIREVHHFRILGNEQYERYHRFGAEEYLLRFGGGLLCPAPGCGAGLIVEGSEKKIVCEIQRTQGCGFAFCRDCRQAYHEGDCNTCGFEVDPVNAERARWEVASKETIQRTTKPCPQCRTPVEKDGGCMHMVCTRCSFNWCWMCDREWQRDCQADHWFG